ncbi:tRNA lysidine(34) synthetase TilS, partial [bacterium]|nr:tRNA lysidine(34) synthetase TilS [bacterium]
MKNKIEKFLIDNKLTASENIIAVGFSGGYDSMVLLDIIKELSKKYNFKTIAAHLNHNWRAKEALKEQENCEDFCKNNNIEFYTETLDANEKHTETRARELRYEFFSRVIKKYNANALLTAHTKSDTAETIVYRLIKGTGIKGLQGISPKLGKIYRPMLDISRKDIEQYCKKNNLNPNCDSSNEDLKYSRNFIRNRILPSFNKINPQAENAI